MDRGKLKVSQKLAAFGCLGVLAALLIWAIVAGRWMSLALPAGLVAGAAITTVVTFTTTRYRLWRFRQAYPGKDLLLVYTDSAAWQARIEDYWLPLWGDRAVVLNRSRPWHRSQPEVRLWQTLAPRQEHTPFAMYLPRSGPRLVVLFYEAFRAYQHGRPAALFAAERELAAALGTAPPPQPAPVAW